MNLLKIEITNGIRARNTSTSGHVGYRANLTSTKTKESRESIEKTNSKSGLFNFSTAVKSTTPQTAYRLPMCLRRSGSADRPWDNSHGLSTTRYVNSIAALFGSLSSQ